MARQHFLEGGYTGKLGETVGFNNRNRRCIRQYFVPTDPNTPKQQATRKGFALAVKLAQQAMNINYGADFWQYGANNEFINRVSTARKRLLAGLSEADAFPLYPDGYIGDLTIAGFNAAYNTSQWEVNFTSTTPVLSEARVFDLTIHYYDRRYEQWHDEVKSVAAPAGQAWRYTADWTGDHSFPDGAYIEAATSDDATHGDQSISLPRQYLTEYQTPYINTEVIIDEVEFDPSGYEAYVYSHLVKYIKEFQFSIRVYNYNPLAGTWGYNQYEMYLDDGYVLNITLPRDDEHSYPPGSYIDGINQGYGDPDWISVDMATFDFNE